MKIRTKLAAGFGALVLLTLLVAALGHVSGENAARRIERTREVRLPTVLASTRAQSDLLRMLSGVRGYLALGEDKYRADYRDARNSFESDVAVLSLLIARHGSDCCGRTMAELKSDFADWASLMPSLFELREDPLQREPALRILMHEAQPELLHILRDVRRLSRSFQTEPPAFGLAASLDDLSGFQSSLHGMIAGIRTYATTGRESFRYEYDANQELNKEFLERLAGNRNRLSPAQAALLDGITERRAAFLEYPRRIFEIVTGDAARKDLFVFKTRAVPLAERMSQRLDTLVAHQEVILQTEMDEGVRRLAAARRRILFGGALAVLFGVSLSLMLARNIVGPVRRLIRVAQAIRDGDLTVRSEIRSEDEIGRLAGTLDRMTEQLHRTMEDLKQAKEAAETADRAKSAFLANMSHELRTPLNAVLGFSELMSRNRRMPEEEQENLRIVRRSGAHLLTLINQVLDLSKMDAGRMTCEPRETDLHRLLDDLADMIGLQARQKGLRLAVSRSPEVPEFVWVDRLRLRQVLINLLGNAVKFTDAGEVSLNVSVSEDAGESLRLCFEVADTGPGIAPEAQEAVFDTFSHACAGDAYKEGAGLGLAISRKFARLMGGDIVMKSAVGSGCVFMCHVPVRRLTVGSGETVPARASEPKRGTGAALSRKAVPMDSSDSAVSLAEAAVFSSACPADCLSRLTQACAAADMTAVEARITEIEAVSPEFGKALRTLAEEFEYAEIQKRLQTVDVGDGK